MTTNGHPHPSPQPGDLAPERRPVKRTLFVEEETDVGREVWEATDRDLLDECLRRGLLTDEQCREMLSGKDTDSNPVNEVVGTTPSGEAVRMAETLAFAQGTSSHRTICGKALGTPGFICALPVGHAPGGQCGTKEEPVRMVGAERAEVEAAPSIDPEAPLTWAKSEIREQVVRHRRERYGESFAYDDGKHALQVVEALIDVLEARERLGRGGA